MSRLLLLPLVWVLFALPSAGQTDLIEVRTRSALARWETEESWALRALQLQSLGEYWHPLAAERIEEALRGRDDRLRAYAIELLLGSHPVSLRCGLTRTCLDQLVNRQLRERNEFHRARVLSVLARAFPYAKAEKPAQWRLWWAEARDDYQPMEWLGGPSLESLGDMRSTSEAIQNAFDLAEADLELVLCIDTTSSMQATIDAVRRGLSDMVVILQGIVPDLRVGLVHYRDYGDLENAAARLETLTNKPERIERQLGRLVAKGGGDAPERVEQGLRFALDPGMGWTRAANKMVLVMGDAPYHGRSGQVTLEIARSAHARPFGATAASLRSAPGRKGPSVRPFLVSAIGVGQTMVVPQTEQAFRSLAEIGGGRYGEFLTSRTGDPRAALLAEILSLCFRCESEALQAFLDVYLAHHDAGYFR